MYQLHMCSLVVLVWCTILVGVHPSQAGISAALGDAAHHAVLFGADGFVQKSLWQGAHRIEVVAAGIAHVRRVIDLFHDAVGRIAPHGAVSSKHEK